MITPGTPEHTRIISASKVPAILGVSPWQSPRGLWHIMRGDVADDFQRGAELDLGHDLEPAIAAMWRRRNPGWRLGRTERQYTNPELPFPHVATLDRVASRGAWRRVVELKSAWEGDEWGEAGTDQIPAPYLVQLMFQMLVAGIKFADLMVLFKWFEARLYHVEFDSELADAIIEQCAAFHLSLAGDTPPDLDGSVATLAVLKRLHPAIDKGTTVDVGTALGVEFLGATHRLELATARDNLVRSRLHEIAGTAQYITANGVRIARRQANRSGASLYTVKADVNDILAAAPPIEQEPVTA